MKRFQNIVFILADEDFNSPSNALQRAVTLANNNQAELTLLHIVPKLSVTSESESFRQRLSELHQQALSNEQQRLQALAHSLPYQTQVQVRSGKKYMEVILAVLAEGYDLVAKAADETLWLDRILGSNDMNLLRKCPCPVWLMRGDEKQDYKNIIAAVDFNAEQSQHHDQQLNTLITDLASSLALSDFATLHVANAYDVPEAGFISLWVEQPDDVERELYETECDIRQSKMNHLLSDMKHRLGEQNYQYLAPRKHLRKGEPAQELAKLAEELEADLVVMGTVSRTGIAGVLIGNTAEAMLSQLTCSVLVVKPEGFVCPINTSS